MNSTDKHIIQEHPQFAINGLFIIILFYLRLPVKFFLHSSKWYLTLIFATQADSGAVQFSQRAAETFRRLSQSDTMDSSCSPGCSCGRRRECEKGLPTDRSVENPICRSVTGYRVRQQVRFPGGCLQGGLENGHGRSQCFAADIQKEGSV